MKFEVKQQIAGTVDEVERAMLDPRYPSFLLEHHGVLNEVQVQEIKDEGNTVRRRIRYLPKPVIKSVGPKEVPPEYFAFIEESTWDKKAKTLTFRNVPTSNAISRMLVNSGSIRLRSAGSGAERQMDGEIKLVLPFLMKPLAPIGERLIHHEGMKILDGEVPVLNRFIAEVLRK